MDVCSDDAYSDSNNNLDYGYGNAKIDNTDN